MSNVAIEIEHVYKQYKLGLVSTGTISHDLNRWWHKVRGKEDPYQKITTVNNRAQKGDSDYVWALEDINFQVNQGEAFGIIGRNGAGKSTLLKILSKVTGPTKGNIKVKGRIASLLEVGTGFHAELTGRENIFLNGAIMGMTRAEVRSKFDEIVDFSGVEKYIDTPVKRYSSGMYVRLAFAVAAHLEPEILVIDEVLAVGDAEFQKKCLGKMKDVSGKDGRTVLFVSHNMGAIKSLCNRGVVLEQGVVKHIGDSTSSISYYLGGGGSEQVNSKNFDNILVSGEFKLNSIGLRSSAFTFNDPLMENLEIELVTDIDIEADDASKYHLTYHLYSEMGDELFSFSHAAQIPLKAGKNKLVCVFPKNFFQSGNYSLSLFVVADKRMPVFIERDIVIFTVVDGGRELGVYMGREPGYIRPQFEWHNEIAL